MNSALVSGLGIAGKLSINRVKCSHIFGWVLSGTIISFATSSMAEEIPVNLRNAGAAQCQDLTAAFESGSEIEKTAYLQWSAGYATAVSQSNSVIDVYPLSETLGLVEIALLICQEPEFVNSRYQVALLTAISRLRPFWAINPSIVTVTDHDSVSISIYRDAVKPLQEALIKLGVKMPADGDFGSMTGRAFSELHKLLDMPETPIPSGVSLYALTKP